MSGAQVLHLATLREGHYDFLYAVRVRIIFVVREGNRLLQTVVRDLEGSAGTGPTYELDLFIHGRWQNALHDVHQGSRLCLQCPRIRPSVGNSRSSRLALHLEDLPTSEMPSKFQVVSFLNDRRETIHSVTFQTLSLPRPSHTAKSCPHPVVRLREPSPNSRKKRRRVAATTNSVIPQPRGKAYSSRSASAAGAATTPDDKFKKIAHVIDSVGNLVSTPINVFGIVTDARAACFTRGTGFRSEISLADESCYDSGEVPLKNLQVYTFEDQVTDAIPFRSYGDIVRVRRGLVKQYTDRRTRGTTAQLYIKFYATVNVWQYDTDSLEPCLSRMALNKSKANEAFHLPPTDQNRLQELRAWVRNFIHRWFRSPRDYIYTVPEVLNRSSMADESVQMLDIVAQVLHVSEEGPNLCMKITDGFKRPCPEHQLIVRSEVDEGGISKAKITKFLDFQRGWSNRPSLPAWVLLKDVRVVTSAGKTFCLLRIGKFSSTILFLDDNAPLVRLVKRQYLNIQENSLQEHDATVPLQHCTDVQQVERREVQVRAPHVRNALKSNNMESRCISSHGQRSPDKDLVKLTQTEPLYDQIPLSEVSKMISDFISGKEIVHRLLVTVVACTFPRNMAHVLRPVCRQCKTHCQISSENDLERFQCDSCGQLFENRGDSRLRWTVVVRLLVRDRSGRAVELWIEGDEGEKFFGLAEGFANGNDESETRQMRRILNTITLPRSVLECCVFAYRYMDTNDIPHVACKLVGTKLLAGYNKKGSDETVSRN